MFNWPKIKNAAFAALAITATLAVSECYGTRAFGAGDQDAVKDFKFPIVLCRFKQAVLKDTSGKLKVVVDRDWGPEQAFAVGNVRALNTRSDNGRMIRVIDGDFAGEYPVPNTSYRLKIEGSIRQGLDSGANHQMRFRTFLQKKLPKPDSNGNLWADVGQAHNVVPAQTQSDGTVWENVYPYTFNSIEMSRFVENGKINQEKLIAGIRDGLLENGAVFKVGPACGFLDARTAKNVASNEDRERYKAIFDSVADVVSAPVVAAKEPSPTKLEAPAPSNASHDTVHESLMAPPAEAVAQAQPELQQAPSNEQGQVPPEQVQAQAQAQAQVQTQTDPAQTEMARQEQMADQAAANYNYLQQQANGSLMVVSGVDAREPASMQPEQVAQAMQAPQTPEQIQQRLGQLEQQKSALEQQQAALIQAQQSAATAQPDPAQAQAEAPQGPVDEQARTQAGPVAGGAF